MALEDDTLLRKRWELSLYIEEYNGVNGLDTPEKRFEALGQRMKEAKERERERVRLEVEAQRRIIVVDILEWQHDS